MSAEREKDGREFVPMLLTTQQAARYLMGKPVVGGAPVCPRLFLQLVERYGLRPKGELHTSRRVGREETTYVRRMWSRRQIDRILG